MTTTEPTLPPDASAQGSRWLRSYLGMRRADPGSGKPDLGDAIARTCSDRLVETTRGRE